MAKNALAGPMDDDPSGEANPDTAVAPASKVTITEPGVYQLTNEQYHADPVPGWSLSSSGARLLMSDPPAVFHHQRTNPKDPTKAMVFGGGAHEWLLEPDRFHDRHLVLPEDHDGRTNIGKARVREAKEAGLRVLTHEEWTTLQAMREAMLRHRYAFAAFQGGRPELSLFWRCPSWGVMCRAKPDYTPGTGRIYGEYKTTLSLDLAELSLTIHNYGYHYQMGWYDEAFRVLGICEKPTMLFVFQSKTPPHLVRCVTLGIPSRIVAEEHNDKAKRIFGVCQKTGEWPEYVEDIQSIDIPSWALGRAEKAGSAGAFEVTDAERELLTWQP